MRVFPPIYGKNTKPLWCQKKSPQNRALSILLSPPTWQLKCHWKLYSFTCGPVLREGSQLWSLNNSPRLLTMCIYYSRTALLRLSCWRARFPSPKSQILSKTDIFIKYSKNKFIEKLKLLNVDIQKFKGIIRFNRHKITLSNSICFWTLSVCI